MSAEQQAQNQARAELAAHQGLKMDLSKDISEHKPVFYAGLLLGIIIALILVYIYQNFMSASAERFVDPNAMDPQTAALVAAHLMSDPVSSRHLTLQTKGNI